MADLIVTGITAAAAPSVTAPPAPVGEPVHLAVPFRIAGDRVATVGAGTIAEVAQSVEVVIGTRKGERLVVPEFGLVDPTFRLEPDSVAGLEAEVERWEPRARLAVTAEIDGTGQLAVEVGVGL